MQYKVESTLDLFTGEITLTKKQASDRAHNLKAIKVDKEGNGLYEITGHVQFKAGEIIGIGNPDKVTLVKLAKMPLTKPDRSDKHLLEA